MKKALTIKSMWRDKERKDDKCTKKWKNESAYTKRR
ncbi:hypothetical protein SAMN05421781_1773 [Marinococcus luteus]|uniref:Uncharacterized protein n=1 Tax=Marinococcus luteus TaxID=1122204 RepID=A0A1H2UMM5_9BACI|nr:hypothetical protein SAMN05421781_1773 [Marinococcus luteus]